MKCHSSRTRLVLLCLAIFALLTAAAQLSAQNLNATAYVSTAAGNQILAVDGTKVGASAVSVLCSGGNKFVPEDVVVGPDGLIYVANTTQDQIWRIDPVAVQTQGAKPSCVSGAGTEKIYDLKTTTGCTDVSSGQPLASSCPPAPEGPSFVSEPTANSTGSLDLVFNIHSSRSTQGVWTIPGIASLPIGCAAALTCPAPVRIIQSFSTAGEGIEFDNPGNMLMVDGGSNGNLFRKAAPLFPILNSFAGAASLFIQGLSSPVGVAVNTCGDILVTSGLSIKRYNSNGLFQDQVTFSSGNIPRFMEIDSSDRLFVVTAADESGTSGKVWLLPLAVPSSPPTACPLVGVPMNLIADLAALRSAKTVANLGSGNALGLGLSATDFTTQTQHFAVNDSTAKVYNFGNNTVAAECDSTQRAFDLKITALKSRPTNSSNPEVTFNSPLECLAPDGTFSFAAPSPVSLHYSSQHGFSTQYWEQPTDPTNSNAPISDSDFNNLFCPDPNFHLRAGFFSLDTIDFPGGAHTDTTGNISPFTIANKPYGDCLTTDVWGTVGPGIDTGVQTTRNSKHVAFTSGSLTENGVISLKQPTLSNNPQFNVGTQNISVKFNLNDAVTGAPITNAIERLSIIRVSTSTGDNTLLPQQVVAGNNSGFENFFNSNGSGQYNFNVDTSFFTLDQPVGTTAIYQFTIWGNDAAPFSFKIVGKF